MVVRSIRAAKERDKGFGVHTERWLNGAKGILIGIALIIPGLSGSIFAVVVGLYDKIIHALNNFKEREARQLLLPVGIGAAIGILLSVRLVLWVCQNFTYQAYSFFIGLVLGSVPLVLHKTRQIDFKMRYAALSVIACVLLLFLATFGTNHDIASSYIDIYRIQSMQQIMQIFMAGLFSCFLMAIPGVSGSIMLMASGQYGSVYFALGNIGNIVFYLLGGDTIGMRSILHSTVLLAIFAAGAAMGIWLAVKILSYLLKNFEALVYYCVMGLLAGAVIILFLGGVFPYAWDAFWMPAHWKPIFSSVGMVILGILCTRISSAKEKA